jgi:hypothetical protein
MIESHLAAEGRSRQALCAVELRSPKPFSFGGFDEFNAGYREILQAWDIPVDGHNPVARTNVAPVVRPPDEPSLYGFAYTLPGETTENSFVVAGAGDVQRQALDSEVIVREGETSADAMREKAAHVMSVMQRRLDGLGCGWAEVTAVNVYTAELLQPYLAETILEPIGAAAMHGVHWHLSRPPIEGLAFEMDLRGVGRELWLE